MTATEKIWAEYHQRLSKFIKSRVAYDAAEDILQDVFEKIHLRIDSLKENAKLESWLFQITRNAVIDYYRSKKSTEQIPDWITETQKDGDELIRKELSTCLGPMIAQLPDKYRVAITLSEIERKTQKEVAELENISLSGAKSRVQRGRTLLKSMLYDCCQIEINHKQQLISYEKRDPDCEHC